MSFFKKIFGQEDKPIKEEENISKEPRISSYKDFWDWFQKHQSTFYKVIKNQGDIEAGFFDKISPKLNEIKEGFYFLAGMYDENTAEFVITAEGNPYNIVFVEELVAAAPTLDGWRFTGLKPALDIENVTIKMDGFVFGKDQLRFFVTDEPAYPDNINITMVHSAYSEETKDAVRQGTFIFLDNFLGELNFLTTIDSISVVGEAKNGEELIPVEKLKDYLIWREKEFLEKYEGVWHDSEEGNFQAMEATLQNGKPLLAIINAGVLNWDCKASHPWLITIEIPFDGNDNSGMPNQMDYYTLNEIEDKIMESLKASDGFVNVGRQTADGERLVFICCKDFRKPSKVLHNLQKEYQSKMPFTFEIYKDKYWQSLDQFKAKVD